MKTHHLNLNHEYFYAVENDEKPFELRKNDRGFQKGDLIVFYNYGTEEKATRSFLGYMNHRSEVVSGYKEHDLVDSFQRYISYVFSGAPGIEAGYVVLGLSAEKVEL